MSASWTSDSALKTAANGFFQAARNAVCVDDAKVKEVFGKGQFRFLKGIVFDMDTSLQEIQSQLVLRCTKLLGPVDKIVDV